MNLFERLVSPDGFMPHGHCYFWQPSILWLHVISDALISIAYLTIPVTLLHIVRRRKDLPFDWILGCFSAFIVACGMTHVLEIWTVWQPVYWLSGVMKAITAVASVSTAILMVKLIPQFLALPGPRILEINQRLEKEIAERQIAEAGLREAKSLLEHVVTFNPAVILALEFVDGELAPKWISGNHHAFMGADPGEDTSRAWWIARLHPDDRELALASETLPYPDDRRITEYRFRRQDGDYFWIRDEKILLRDAEGQPSEVLVSLVNITERKQVEESLQRQQTELRVLFDLIPALIWFKDTKNRTIRVNERAAKAAGKRVDEIEGRSMHETYPEEAAQYYADDLEVIHSRVPKLGIVEKLRDEMGQAIWIRTNKVPYCNQYGEVIGIVVMAEDISEQKRAEEAKAAAENSLRLAVTAANIGLWDWDFTSNAVYFSPEWKSQLGYAEHEIANHFDEWDSRIHPDDLAATQARVKTLITNPSAPYELEFRLRHKDGGYRWIFSRGCVLPDPAGRPARMVGCHVDITERKLAEAETKALHRQLLDTSRRAGMAEVATSVLHNVGNVLNSVNVSVAILVEKVRRSCHSDVARLASLLQANREDLPTFLKSAQGSQLPDFMTHVAEFLAEENHAVLAELHSLGAHIDHIKEIVAMQQSYARISGVLEELSPVTLIEDAVRMNAAALKRHGIALVRDFEEMPLLEVDKHRVLQILVNLIRNAKYAMDEPDARGKRMTLSLRATPAAACISVRDEGNGIPPENLTRIFEHGFTTRKDGHGFGLHSAALAAKEMGGSLTAQSDGHSRGACFTLTLPLAKHSIELLAPAGAGRS